MSELLQDLRHALRGLRRQPGFSLVVVLTLAVGLGANTAIFTYFNALLWPTFEAPRPEQLAWFEQGPPKAPWGQLSWSDFEHYRQHASSFRSLTCWNYLGTTVGLPGSSDEDGPVFAWAQPSCADYFAIFDHRPHLGRTFEPADDLPDAARTVVLSHGFWQRRLGADPTAVGRTLHLNGLPFTIIGVAARGFQAQGVTAELYLLIRHRGELLDLRGDPDREHGGLTVLGRLEPGVELAQARAQASSLAAALDQQAPWQSGPRAVTLRPVSELHPTEKNLLRPAAWLLMSGVGLLLLLACANVANLMLARNTLRRRELAVHVALGASRARLARKLWTESLLLAGLAAVLGLALAHALSGVMEGFLHTVPVGLGSWSADSQVLQLSSRVYGFTLGLAVLTGLGCGLAPVLQLRRQSLVASLKADSGSASPKWLAPRQLLVVCQVTLSVVLLLGAGLLARSLGAMQRVTPGFDTDRLLLAGLFLPRRAGSEEAALNLYRDLQERVATLPGVAAASLTQQIPLSGGSRSTTLDWPPGRDARDDQPLVNFTVVAPDYFATLGIPLLRGRDLDARDRQDTPPVVVINRSLEAWLHARGLPPNQDPVGLRLRLPELESAQAPAGEFEIVGIAGDSREVRLDQPPEPQVYLPVQQRFMQRMNLLLRTDGPPAVLGAPLRTLLAQHYPQLAVIELAPFAEQYRRSLAEPRLYSLLAGGFSLLGLVLAVSGVFSVMAYTVSQRRREFAIRMATGATPRQVLTQVLRQALVLVGSGLVLGLTAGATLAGLLNHLLFGVASHDPLTFTATALGLAAAALAAAVLPARRAARVDPQQALREG